MSKFEIKLNKDKLYVVVMAWLAAVAVYFIGEGLSIGIWPFSWGLTITAAWFLATMFAFPYPKGNLDGWLVKEVKGE